MNRNLQPLLASLFRSEGFRSPLEPFPTVAQIKIRALYGGINTAGGKSCGGIDWLSFVPENPFAARSDGTNLSDKSAKSRRRRCETMVAQRGSAGLIAKYERGPSRGDTGKTFAIQSFMKQPTNQEERNEDKKKPEKENPSHGIDPESKEPEMETDQDPGERQKENQNQEKDDPLAA
jgi:hypothetical protein